MAEFLIYKGPHWMDALTPEQVAAEVEKSSGFQEKYDNRSEIGDIIETAPDGRYGKDGHNKKHYHITVAGMTWAEVRKYQQIQQREPTEQEAAMYSTSPIFLKKRRYKLDVIRFPSLATKPRLTITKTQFLAALVDKD